MSLLGNIEISEPGAAGDGFIVRRIKLGLDQLPEIEVYARLDGVVRIRPLFPRGDYMGEYRFGNDLNKFSATRWIRREIATRAYADGKLIDEIMGHVEATVKLLQDDLVRSVTPTHE